MADRELRRMHRAELIEIIYALKQSEDQPQNITSLPLRTR